MHLGVRHEHGRGVPKDAEQSVRPFATPPSGGTSSACATWATCIYGAKESHRALPKRTNGI
jgi:TPR repeat protein